MPVNVRLNDDHTYLIYEFQEPLSMEELLEAYQQERAYRNATDQTLHSIVDLSTIRMIPPNWLTAKAGPGLTHPRSGKMLFVGLSFGIKIIVETILKIARYDRMLFFNTRDEAEAYMQTLVSRSEQV